MADLAIAEILAPDEVAAVRLPLESAHFLPPRVYSDPTVFQIEKEGLFRTSWLPLCHISQLGENGSYITRNLFGEPVMAVRDREGTIRVLSNVCRHRNALVAQDSGKCRGNRFVCPYHGWAYGLDGKLLSAPFMDKTADFDRRDIALPEVRFEIWEGFVFVNLDGNAAPLGEQLTTLTQKVAPYRFDKMTAVEIRRAKVPWNWKVSLENFSEAYHQPFIHPKTADTDFPAKTAIYEDTDGPYSLFWIPHRTNEITPTVVPAVPDMPDSYYRGFAVMNIYPLFHMFTDAATPLWLDWEITGVNEHEMVWYMMVPAHELSDDNLEQVKVDFLHFIEPILLEDVDVCTAVGKGVGSTFAQQGRLSWMEKAVHQFQNWWLDNL